MKISEVNAATEQYTVADLRKLVKEMYKCMPKKVREEKNVDALVLNMEDFLATKAAKKKQDKQNKQGDLPVLATEITSFIENAKQGYYLKANSVISQKERTKWRKIVHNFIARLVTVPAKTPSGQQATALLGKLYNLLSMIGEESPFGLEDQFTPVGFSQPVLYGVLVRRLFAWKVDQETIDQALDYLFLNDVAFDSIRSDLSNVLLAVLRTSSTQELVLAAVKQRMPVTLPARSSKDFLQQVELNNGYTRLIMFLEFKLKRNAQGIAYFKKYFRAEDQQILFQTLLDCLEDNELFTEWVTEYENGVQAGVRYNDELQLEYEVIREACVQTKEELFEAIISRD